MIKKLFIFLFISIIGIAIIIPKNTNAQTIQQFEEEIEKYTAELQAKKNAIAKNDKEVAEIEAKIKSIQAEIKTLQQEVNDLQAEIDESNKEIEKKTAQSKKLIEYYQVSNGENAYLQYVFGAESITDMIYRISVVEQLTEYNDNLMKELQKLIEQNKIRQKELDQKQKDLTAKQKELKDEQAKIESDTQAIKESMPSVEQQIKSAQANVKYYKALGCGQTEDILKCQYRIEQARAAASSSGGGSSSGGSIPSTNGFYRPMQYGYVTQGYGGAGGHLGVDLSSSNKSIPIYPIANGQVFFKGYDCYGALVVKIKHNYNGRYIYSTYAHMRSFGNISKGQYISYATSIGNMGSTGWSTGPHLHLEITTCDWNAGGGCTYATYKRSTINPFSLISLPSSWTNR